MSDVFKSQDLFLPAIENINFKLKANLDIFDLIKDVAIEHLQKKYEMVIKELTIEKYKKQFRKCFKDYETEIR